MPAPKLTFHTSKQSHKLTPWVAFFSLSQHIPQHHGKENNCQAYPILAEATTGHLLAPKALGYTLTLLIGYSHHIWAIYRKSIADILNEKRERCHNWENRTLQAVTFCTLSLRKIGISWGHQKYRMLQKAALALPSFHFTSFPKSPPVVIKHPGHQKPVTTSIWSRGMSANTSFRQS